MGLDSWLSSDVGIQRGTQTLDAYGNAVLDWYDVALVPGRLVEKRERVWVSERAEAMVVTNYLLLVPAGTDVQERDRVMIGDVAYVVMALLERNARAAHHLSLTLDKVA